MAGAGLARRLRGVASIKVIVAGAKATGNGPSDPKTVSRTRSALIIRGLNIEAETAAVPSAPSQSHTEPTISKDSPAATLIEFRFY